MKLHTVLFSMLFNMAILAEKSDLVLFSYDRPLQLYALLESVDKYMEGFNKIFVIYRASSKAFEKAYKEVQAAFADPIFLYQQSKKDFRRLTIESISDSDTRYIMFGVDDIIVKDFVDISHCIQLLEKYNAYGFYLRMGTHLTSAYPATTLQPLPPLIEMEPEVFSWVFKSAIHDWGYPNTVDMTLYRKKDISALLKTIPYETPNKLESQWAARGHLVHHRIGLCFTNSKIVNIPLNIVQGDFKNVHMDFMSTAELLSIFVDKNKKIDINPLFKIKNGGSHFDYTPTFVRR